MKAVMLVPHADDETLFASHVIMRFDPEIALVFLPREEDEQTVRVGEFHRAVAALGGRPVYRWLDGHEGEQLADLPARIATLREEFDYAFAPFPMSGGHQEHNAVGSVARELWAAHQITFYHTYTREGGRVRADHEYTLTTTMIRAKLRALAEYRSQIEHPARRPWFYELLDLREWYA